MKKILIFLTITLSFILPFFSVFAQTLAASDAPAASSQDSTAKSELDHWEDAQGQNAIEPAAAPTLKPVSLESEPPRLENTLESGEQAKIVKSVDIRGNKTIGIATILTKIKTKAGQEYSQNIISDDIKRLYNTGYFADISVDREDVDGGFKVIFYLKEKPIIDKITFTKTRYYNSRFLLTKITTKEGKFLDQKVLMDDVDIIKELYVKKGMTTATVDVETDLDEATHKAKLHFVINEGYRVKIVRMNVENNQAFPDKRVIKLIKSRRAWLFNAGFLKEDLLKEDMERIKDFYEKEGFMDAEASFKIETGAKGRATVIISVNEGKRYYTGKIVIAGNAVVAENDILGAMTEIKVGKTFSRSRLDLDLAQIRTLYFDKGYIFANVKESTSLNPDTGKVEINLAVQEGSLAYVRKVKIQGNTRTRDIVIRRELRLNPGDQFDGVKLRRSKERLRNLGYFEDIGYDIEDTDVADQKDLVVQVKEAKTGTFSFGGGFSTIDRLVGFVEIEQKNFDFANWPTFTGGGQNLLFRAEAGSVRTNLRLSFTEPWLFDHPISGGFDVYRSERQKERDIGYAYDELRTGGGVRFGKQLSEYWSANTGYTYETIKISDLDSNVSADLASEEGENAVSTVNFRLARDSRDNVFSPTKGLFTSGTTEVAGGALGGDKDFVKFHTRSSYYVPLKFKSVLEFRLLTGIADSYGDTGKVPIFERYFAGGANTIRGYNERKVGPIDSVTEDPIGGEAMLVGNIEYTIPLIEFIKLAGFFDTGNVWSKLSDFGKDGYKSGTGLGFRVKTPIGPVSLDYGWPLNDEPGEEDRQGQFYFNISRGF